MNLSDSSDGSDLIGKVVDIQDWQSEASVSVLCEDIIIIMVAISNSKWHVQQEWPFSKGPNTVDTQVYVDT